MPDCCYIEQPCHAHLTKALGDKIKDFDPAKVTITVNNVPQWLARQFLGWRHDAIHEDDFMKSFQYMATSGIMLYDGKTIDSHV